MLNPDGTKKKDQITGKAIPTYSNDDIMNFSRGWTNFVLQNDERDNIEAEWNQGWMTNRVDPMTLPSSVSFFPSDASIQNCLTNNYPTPHTHSGGKRLLSETDPSCGW